MQLIECADHFFAGVFLLCSVAELLAIFSKSLYLCAFLLVVRDLVYELELQFVYDVLLRLLLFYLVPGVLHLHLQIFVLLLKTVNKALRFVNSLLLLFNLLLVLEFLLFQKLLLDLL